LNHRNSILASDCRKHGENIGTQGADPGQHA
jgi:hypothetical protein